MQVSSSVVLMAVNSLLFHSLFQFVKCLCRINKKIKKYCYFKNYKMEFKLAKLNVAPFYKRLIVGKQSESWARYLVA